MSKKNELISAINNLRPYQVVNTTTGEILNSAIWQQNVKTFLSYCQEKATATLDQYKDQLNNLLQDERIKIGAPTTFAWKHDIRPNLSDYPNNCLAASRVEKIIQHEVISLFSSYFYNDNPKKRFPTVPLFANLGAADKQIAEVQIEDKTLILTFKCWDNEYDMFFLLPLYVDNYDIKKIALPSIRWDNKKDEPIFTFSIYENFQYKFDTKSKIAKRIVAGYDLGRKQPFALSITNYRGGIIAEYTATSRLKDLNTKRENIIKEKKNIVSKLRAYRSLDIYPEKVEVLERERDYKTAKIKALGKEIALQMGREIADLCVKHDVDIITCENLSWINDAIGRSSRWNHSKQQDAIEHACKRVGVKQVKRSAKNTSKTCCECGSKNVAVSSVKRTVTCKDCSSVVDRDISSARFQARREAKRLERARWSELLLMKRRRSAVRSLLASSSWFPVRYGVGTGCIVELFLSSGTEALGLGWSDRISYLISLTTNNTN